MPSVTSQASLLSHRSGSSLSILLGHLLDDGVHLWRRYILNSGLFRWLQRGVLATSLLSWLVAPDMLVNLELVR